jgi:primosomal protein N' (replication factor Y)
MPHFAKIIFPIPINEGFTYSIPLDLVNLVKPGMQVVLPVKNRFLSGIVLDVQQQPPVDLNQKDIKPISEVIYDTPVVSEELMQLMEWISRYYICYLGEVYRLLHLDLNIRSSRLFFKRKIRSEYDDLTELQRRILENIPEHEEVSLIFLKKRIKEKSLLQSLLRIEKLGYISRHYGEIQKILPQKMEDFFRLVPEPKRESTAQQLYIKILSGRSTKSQEMLGLFSESDWIPFSSLKKLGYSRSLLSKLCEASLLEKKTIPLDRAFSLPYEESVPEVVPTVEQKKIINNVAEYLNRTQFKAFLIHGITGSGKTQIYIELIKKALAIDRQAIVLIPEIVLTPQILSRFRANFGERVVALHSRFSRGEKREILFKIRKGLFDVIVGPRSAIFAPVRNLGLIIIDEEHESSYKQSDSQPRYHARDVAIYRGRLNNAVVVLGSATPSFESLSNAKEGKYGYFQLKKRIEKRKLPRISLIDLREDWKKFKQMPVFSNSLELKIESRLLFQEQIMILQNRRGYSPYILCKDCGFVAKCKNCDITLTYHQNNRELICHYCGYSEKAPDVCPTCQGIDLLFKGIGTQRLEELLNEQFPHARVLRMDQDTTKGKHGHAKILDKFGKEQSDILLGTQMIAKGLDFQKVSLVGIVSADLGLHFPDFRANEKTFQLLTQAAGRAGRGEQAGEVVVQTFDPGHFIYKYLISHDYDSFFIDEIEHRRMLNYPPFSRLILLKIEGKNLKEVEKYSQILVKFLWKANQPKIFTVLGPSPAFIPKIQNMYRYQILLKQDKSADESMSRLRHLIRESIYLDSNVKKWPVKIYIDVDPIDIL